MRAEPRFEAFDIGGALQVQADVSGGEPGNDAKIEF
jgi:hypothetical protein